MFNRFYEGKRILVTGVAGVKGSWLALLLLEAGAKVVGVDIKLPEGDSNFILSGVGESIDFVQGDVTNLQLMRDLLSGVDALFHLAAVVLVGQARRDPLEAYRTNTLGVATMLEALRLSVTPKAAVFVTTDKVYKPKPHGEPWVETDPLLASGPYPVSKACAEFIIQDYQQAYFQRAGIRIAVGRAGNVIIGGDQYSSSRTQGAGRIAPDCFEALAEGRAPEIFAPEFTRPYTYGLDILAGYMTLLSKLVECDGVAGGAYNFGPYEMVGVPNALLATKACELWQGGIAWRSGSPREEPFDHQSLAWHKSQRVLGWRPAFTFYEALQATASWYKEWSQRKAQGGGAGCMRDFNRALMLAHQAGACNLGIEWALDAPPVR